MRSNRFRTVVFQTHLWGGLILGIYAFLIGITGSVLVFHEELAERIAPEPRLADHGRTGPLDEIHARIQARFPGWHAFSLQAPREPGQPWSSYLLRSGKGRLVFADSEGNVIGERDLTGTWLRLAEQFHSNLLMPRGRLYNGVLGLLMAVLAMTGALLWWPARGEWSGAFQVVRRASWKGITYDLHRVGGALTFAFAVMFCVTGAYFTWPAVYRQIVGTVLPVNSRPGPAVRIEAGDRRARLPLDALAASARKRVPDGELMRILIPQSATQPVRVVFRHGDPHENRKTSQISVNPYTGEIANADLYVQRKAGDRVVSLLGPLHNGHLGGFAVKVIWAIAGLALPALFVTGFLMWWNRVLVPRARRRTSREPVEARVEATTRQGDWQPRNK